MRTATNLALLGLAFALTSCMSAAQHAAQVDQARNGTQTTTLGQVQREIRIGMPSSDVVAALGSPNMVTTDENRRETWVYDKV